MECKKAGLLPCFFFNMNRTVLTALLIIITSGAALSSSMENMADGYALERDGKFREAIARFRDIYVKDPGNSYADEAAYSEIRIYNEKLRDYATVLRLSSVFMDMYPQSRYAGRLSERLSFLKSLDSSDYEPLKIFEDSSSTYFKNPGVSLGRIEAIPLNFPSFRLLDRVYIWLGDEYGRKKEIEKSLLYYNTMLEKFPSSPLATACRRAIATLYFNNGDYRKARAVFYELTRSDDKSVKFEATGRVANMDRHIARRNYFFAFMAAIILFVIFIASSVPWKSLTGHMLKTASIELVFLVPILGFLYHLSGERNPPVTNSLLFILVCIPAMIFLNNIYLAGSRRPLALRIINPFAITIVSFLLIYVIMEKNDLVFTLEYTLRMR